MLAVSRIEAHPKLRLNSEAKFLYRPLEEVEFCTFVLRCHWYFDPDLEVSSLGSTLNLESC